MMRNIFTAASAVALLVGSSVGLAQTTEDAGVGTSQVPGTIESYDEATGDVIVRFRTIEPMDMTVVHLGKPVFVIFDAEGIRGISEDPVQVGENAPDDQGIGPSGGDVAAEPTAGDVQVGEDTPIGQESGAGNAVIEPAAGDVGTDNPPTDQATGTGATAN